MSISLKNLIFNYPGSDAGPILDIEQWSVESGERVFLRGPSGSGKSTLLHILSGLLTIKHGDVSILGESLLGMSVRRRDQFRAAHVGYVFQQFNLIPYLDALDNVLLAPFFSRPLSGAFRLPKGKLKQAQDLLQRLNLKESLWRCPAANLSIGQQQRVAIARAFINQPEILIVDEPTSSLDERNRDAFMSLLLTFLDDFPSTLIFVSHDLSLAKYFPREDVLVEMNRAYQEPAAD